MSVTEHPPGHGDGGTGQPDPQQEPRCRRCGSALSPGQDWCLHCGAATTSHVAEPRGWRAPILIAALLAALAIAAAVLAIVELSDGPERVVDVQATPTPTVSAAPTVTPTVDPLDPNATSTIDPLNPNATPTATIPGTGTATPGASPTPDGSATPGASATPEPTASATSTPTTGSGEFASWPSGQSGWTIIQASSASRSGAESIARSLQGQGATVGILRSDDYSSLRSGYWVVFSGQYSSRSQAQSALSSSSAKRPGAYVRRISG